ncbi:MAG: ATP-dependent Clp protease ATP-binding subunit [Anaerolineaceae bacterium]|nr:ATP-dependent Clp protease ATP-binding subunit [Anaerolineaceae bacterium]
MAGIDQFTQRARRVLSLAHKEAAMNHTIQIGTEHLLLGLIQVPGSTAGKVLENLEVTADRVRQLNASIEPDEPALELRHPQDSLSPDVQEVLRDAVRLAAASRDNYVSTEHLLLSLIDSANSRAVRILARMGLTGDRIRQELRNTLENGSGTSVQREQQAPPPPEFAEVGANRRQQGLKKKESPLMDQLATDLTAKAAAGKLDPVVGRKTEIERVIQILARRTKNNPALIGEPGVGKTAIVEGLAQAVVDGNVPAQLLNKRVLQLDVGSLVAGTMYRGQFEERLKRVIDELKSTQAILFIDEIHMLVGAGSGGSAVDAANILKPALSRGEIQVIGATTTEEYRKNIEKDPALERRFQSVSVGEPSVEETVEILRGIRPKYEDHHQLVITDDALEAAAELSKRYISERFLPDKAIDLIDEAASRVRMYKSPRAAQSNEMIKQLRGVWKEQMLASEQNDKNTLARLQNQESSLRQQIENLNKNWDRMNSPRVTVEDVAEVVSMWTGIPAGQMSTSETERLLKMEEELKKSIIGQDEAITSISQAIRRSRSGLKDPRRPIGSFLFLGPTGVGKTELTKTLAKFLFGSEDALLQFDMSEFMERHTASRLTGAPPGYIGYDDSGQLTEAIRRKPYSIVVFDEIDKANPEIHNMLLQIMEEGHLTDSRGKKVDFRNAIIVMTSNIGAEVIRKQGSIGFDLIGTEENAEKAGYEDMRKKLMERLKKAFRPEFLNRLDNVVVFRALNMDDMQRITELEFNKVGALLADQDITLQINETALEKLTREGFDPEMGARPLRRVIQEKVENPLSEALLSHRFHDGDTILFTLDKNGELKMSKKRTRSSRPELVEHPPLPSAY